MSKEKEVKGFEVQFQELNSLSNRASVANTDLEETKEERKPKVHRFGMINNQSITFDTHQKVKSALLSFNTALGILSFIYGTIELFGLYYTDKNSSDGYRYVKYYWAAAVYVSIIHLLIVIALAIIWEFKWAKGLKMLNIL